MSITPSCSWHLGHCVRADEGMVPPRSIAALHGVRRAGGSAYARGRKDLFKTTHGRGTPASCGRFGMPPIAALSTQEPDHPMRLRFDLAVCAATGGTY